MKYRYFIYDQLPGADLGGGCRGCAPPPHPRDDLRFSNTTGILQKKKTTTTMWFIGVEVDQEMSAPPPRKNPGSAPGYAYLKLYPSHLFVYLRPCMHQRSTSDIARKYEKTLNRSVQRLKSPVIGSLTNFIID